MNIDNIIISETKRISENLKKDYLECADIMKLTGLGRDKVREMMNSKSFPTSKYGRKKTVSISAFLIWQMKNNTNGDIYDETK